MITRDNTVLDSEIIRDLESRKNDFRFSINCRNSFYYTLFMDAVKWSRKELVKYLLTYPYIKINDKNDNGDTALIIACHRDDVDICKLLLCREDLDVNIKCRYGYTGLHNAYKGTTRELLLDARADIMIRTHHGNTAQDIAIYMGYCDIAKIINNSRYTTLLRIPNETLLFDIVRMIIEKYI